MRSPDFGAAPDTCGRPPSASLPDFPADNRVPRVSLLPPEARLAQSVEAVRAGEEHLRGLVARLPVSAAEGTALLAGVAAVVRAAKAEGTWALAVRTLPRLPRRGSAG